MSQCCLTSKKHVFRSVIGLLSKQLLTSWLDVLFILPCLSSLDIWVGVVFHQKNPFLVFICSSKFSIIVSLCIPNGKWNQSFIFHISAFDLKKINFTSFEHKMNTFDYCSKSLALILQFSSILEFSYWYLKFWKEKKISQKLKEKSILLVENWC